MEDYSQDYTYEAMMKRQEKTPRLSNIQIAGIVLLLNAAFSVLEMIINIEGGEFNRSFFWDIIIGASLVWKKEKWVKWAMIRAVVGLVIYTIMYIGQREYEMVVVQLLFTGVIIGLLAGEPGLLRRRISIGVGLLLLLVFSYGTYSEIAGPADVVARSINASIYDLESEAVTDYHHEAMGYRLNFPNTDWFARRRESIIKDNPDVDLWFVQPSVESHLQLTHEVLEPELLISLDEYVALFKAQMLENESERSLINERVIGDENARGHIITFEDRSDADMPIAFQTGLFLTEQHAYKLFCFTSFNEYEIMKQDFDHIMHSFAVDGETFLSE